MGALDFGPFLVLTDETRTRLGAAARTMRIPAGEPFIREQSASSGAYVLTEGRLRIVEVKNGKTLGTLEPPALVGEVGPVLGRPRSATVIADAACTVLFLPIFDLREAIADEPQFEKALRDEIEERMGAGG